MSHIDGIVAAVSSTGREACRKHAAAAAAVFKEHGALKVVEDRLALAPGARRQHGQGHGRPAPAAHAKPMPFDGKRLIYGGFEVLVEA